MISNATSRLTKAEEEAFKNVNTLLLNTLNRKVKASPTRDMTELLEHQAKSYPALGAIFRDVAVQSATQELDCSNETEADERTKFQVPTNATIIRPLSVTASRAALNDSDDSGLCSDLSVMIEGLNKLVATSEVIWHLGSTAVPGLNSEFVMKIGNKTSFIGSYSPAVVKEVMQ